jgi:hypothetical protein
VQSLEFLLCLSLQSLLALEELFVCRGIAMIGVDVLIVGLVVVVDSSHTARTARDRGRTVSSSASAEAGGTGGPPSTDSLFPSDPSASRASSDPMVCVAVPRGGLGWTKMSGKV